MILLVVLFSGINAAIMRLMHKDNAFIRNCQLVIAFGGLFNTDFHKCGTPHADWRDFLSHTDLTDENRLIYSANAAVLINTDYHKKW